VIAPAETTFGARLMIVSHSRRFIFIVARLYRREIEAFGYSF
jgi:hypothetical protein